MNITNINDDYMELIKIFVRSWCNRYCINYDMYFSEAEELSEVAEIKTLFGKRVINSDREYIEYAAEVLGTTPKVIVELDNDKIGLHYDKYKYFRLYPEALKAYNEQFEEHTSVYLNLIRETNIEKGITTRVLDFTKKYEEFVPGTYHKDATITDLMIESDIIASYSGAKELWESYIEMVERVQQLFYKAIKGKKLRKKEINEYNILVSVLNITECMLGPSKKLYYSLLKKFINLYQEEGYNEFYSYARVNLGLFSESRIHPWCFKETATDKNIIQKYINIHPVINGKFTKEYLLKYAMKTKNLHCTFEWSDALFIESENDDFDLDTGFEDFDNKKLKERSEIYLPKEEECVQDYIDECNYLCKLASPVNAGGVTMPQRELPYQHYYHMNTELWRKRFDARMRGVQYE